MRKVKRWYKKLKEYNKIANIAEIGRRYFAMNSFDGILTIFGLLIGSFLVGVTDNRIVISTGLAASIGMGMSGIWGTFLTEEAERIRKLKELSKSTLTDLKSTRIARAEKAASYILSLLAGVSPLLMAILILTPFFFSSLIGTKIAYMISFCTAFLLLSSLGIFLAHVARENRIVSVFKMIAVGIICMVIIYLMGLIN